MSVREAIAGQRILITGGSSGIGLATAQRLGGAGARLILLARGADALREALDAVPGAEGYVVADVADPQAVEQAVAEASRRLGGLDAVVSASAAASYGPFLELASEDYRKTLESTLLGAINTAHAAIPRLAERGGRLVFVASVAARVPVPWLAPYAAAKHGLRGFARSLAGELHAQKVPVRLALVHPGPVDTRFWVRVRTPDRRLPPEIAGAYRPEDVAAEIQRALEGDGAMERTVGGLMALWVMADALAPNAMLAAMKPFARLGWRRREDRPRSEQDALDQPLQEARRSGGLASRPSLLTWARQAVRAPGPGSGAK